MIDIAMMELVFLGLSSWSIRFAPPLRGLSFDDRDRSAALSENSMRGDHFGSGLWLICRSNLFVERSCQKQSWGLAIHSYFIH